jgi:hypothetical protein
LGNSSDWVPGFQIEFQLMNRSSMPWRATPVGYCALNGFILMTKGVSVTQRAISSTTTFKNINLLISSRHRNGQTHLIHIKIFCSFEFLSRDAGIVGPLERSMNH